jgi:phosphoglycolate phosphatase-like HAD superfamily hydrolase
MLKAVIFDFDGTIADTLPIIVTIANRLSGEFHYPRITDPEKFRDKTLFQVIRKELKIPILKLPLFKRRIMQGYRKEFVNVLPFTGMSDVIAELRRKHLVGILTSNNKKYVEMVLKKGGIKVDFIHARSPLFGKHRDIIMALRKHFIKRDEAIYVGDEVRDIEACRRARVRIISVTWGLNTRRIIKEYKPDFMAERPEEILKIAQKSSNS